MLNTIAYGYRKFLLTLAFFAWILLHSTFCIADDASDYLRDVQPILAQHCFKCHGPDEKSREAGLRLDLRDAALIGGASNEAAIVPLKPNESALIARLLSNDDDFVMPPPSEKQKPTQQQIETLQRWIASGANYAKHWAFEPPVKPMIPEGAHPIDVLVKRNLDKQNLAPSQPAESAVLARRVYLDVLGLPPTTQEAAEFEKDGLERTLDRLFTSKRYGEKWARHWLDAARYSDSNGYERDYPREQWAWRDWVVGAINNDMPYDQFIVEQIAGDLLPNRTQDQLVATGFLRNSMTNEEGAIVPEQFRMEEMFDRMDCIGKSILGLTLQCAQCHSHKFDPITHEDYYGVFAFLNNSYEARSAIYTVNQLAEIARLRSEIDAVERKLRSERSDWKMEMHAWADEIKSRQPAWRVIDPEDLDSTGGMNHPTKEPGLSILTQGSTSPGAYVLVTAEPNLEGVTGLLLEALPHRDLAFGGPGRGKFGAWVVSELQVSVRKPGEKEFKDVKLSNATADYSQPEHPEPVEWAATPKKASTVATDKPAPKKVDRLCGPVKFLIDGKLETSWRADRGAGRRNVPSSAVIQFDEPLDLAPGTKLKVSIHLSGGLWPFSMQLGHLRLSLTTDAAPQASSIDHAAILAMQTPSDSLSETEQAALFEAWRKSVSDLKPFNDQIESLWTKFPEPDTSVLHLAERDPSQFRETKLLDRGIWDKPLQLVSPNVPKALHEFKSDAAPDRLAFARWLSDRRSPLTARVAVNRVWQSIFGKGLVETSEDFGSRAPIPEQQALLDWLAVDFVEHGWSQRHLIRTIMTSATYQQSSIATADLLERDPGNKFLARGPRFRLDAEVVRDVALSLSGLLHHREGGAPIFPPVPESVLEYNYTKPEYWKPPQDENRYVRAIYLFRKRSMPDPMLSSFDAPSSDFACSRRVRSNTAIAALTGLNETIMFESAQALAIRILREGGYDDAERADYAYRLCVSRSILPSERQSLLELLAKTRRRIADGWLNPREISTGDPARLPQLPNATTPADAAAWTVAARVLINLDETLSKN